MFCTKSAEMPTDAEGDSKRGGKREGGRKVKQGLPCSNKDVAPQAAAWPLARRLAADSACQTNVCRIIFSVAQRGVYAMSACSLCVL